VRWLMGSLDVGGYSAIVASLVPMALAGGGDATPPRTLAPLTPGPGAPPPRGGGAAAAGRRARPPPPPSPRAAVSLAGPIGFIGIVVPHLVRMLVGADHRLVLPGAALFGAAFLIGCDLVARTIASPVELPVGIVTAMIGGPFFLWLLLRRTR